MSRLVLLALTLSACNQWVRPTPPPATKRTPEQQRDAAVRVETYCDPFEDGTLGKSKIGSGVMVSDWQVLTALHVVDCPSAIAQVRVTNSRGQRWRLVSETEWVFSYLQGRDGVARIQLSSGDTLRPRLAPPALRDGGGWLPYGPLYVQAAQPTFEERIGEVEGHYGGDSYGGSIFTYTGSTEPGNSGAGVYDIDGALVGVHLGTWTDDGKIKYAAVVTDKMMPH